VIGLQRETRLAVIDSVEDLRVSERRDVSSNGFVESQMACLDQPERGDARDRLRHRGEPEDRVGLDRQIGVDIAPPDAVELERLVAASHERDRARDLRSSNAVLEEPVSFVER
jgi:hypothetical protein